MTFSSKGLGTPTVGLWAEFGHLISQLQPSVYLLGYCEEV